MCFRPPQATAGARMCPVCHTANDDPAATICAKCGADLGGLGSLGSAGAPPAAGKAGAPKVPPAPPRIPKKPPGQ